MSRHTSAADSLVPIVHAYTLHHALPSAELWTIPGTDHVAGYKHDPVEYVRRIGDFFDRSLPK